MTGWPSAGASAQACSTAAEQVVDGWYVKNPTTGEDEQAYLDVVTADPLTGAVLRIDVTIPCELSSNHDLMRSRAIRDGRAAADAAAAKHRKYPLGGASLIPFVLEAGGRPGEDTVVTIRRMAAAARGERGEEGAREAGLTAAQLWQELSIILQNGNAEIILSAIGR